MQNAECKMHNDREYEGAGRGASRSESKYL